MQVTIQWWHMFDIYCWHVAWHDSSVYLACWNASIRFADVTIFGLCLYKYQEMIEKHQIDETANRIVQLHIYIYISSYVITLLCFTAVNGPYLIYTTFSIDILIPTMDSFACMAIRSCRIKRASNVSMLNLHIRRYRRRQHLRNMDTATKCSHFEDASLIEVIPNRR